MVFEDSKRQNQYEAVRFAEKREKKMQKLEKRIRKKANKKLFGTTGVKIPISKARDELYYELKNIWYGNVV